MPDERGAPRWTAVALPLLGAVVAVGLWWGATALFGIRSFFLPSPPDVVAAFREQPEYLLKEAWATLEMTGLGFLIALAAGLLMAMLLTMSRAVERATLPLLVALNSIPKVALAPLLIVWLGYGPGPKLVMIVLISFFPILVAAAAGLSSTPADLGELAKSLSASWWQAYLKVRLPWALPQVFVGLKLGISLAVIGAVVAEISSPNGGLGSVVVLSGASLDTPLAFAAITLLAILSIVLFYLVVGLERLLLPWARAITA
ncbi:MULTISPECIES: ABC transporter permease [Dactylosporangium]|uniref:ABC transporter permease n=2 Tax=Dactylosporangium TaxID=35753 RepID=A0A9W6KVG4_9ACTN|nr:MULTISPECIES: ABC transporter permease [Dactylosporangium]UAB94502.1 ABC transporter permease [Dactylosporangium vinaceum]UWZ42875.1 ABC transporter permease [Dactylosporangium matsuzakiense]GLL07311.1 ABC transporter permease [Dactylosporangium matsuzakiense]